MTAVKAGALQYMTCSMLPSMHLACVFGTRGFRENFRTTSSNPAVWGVIITRESMYYSKRLTVESLNTDYGRFDSSPFLATRTLSHQGLVASFRVQTQSSLISRVERTPAPKSERGPVYRLTHRIDRYPARYSSFLSQISTNPFVFGQRSAYITTAVSSAISTKVCRRDNRPRAVEETDTYN